MPWRRTLQPYIMGLPKKEADTAEWQAAIEALMLVAELGGPDDVCAHRRHESLEPPRRARVRSVEGQALGTPPAGKRSMTL